VLRHICEQLSFNEDDDFTGSLYGEDMPVLMDMSGESALDLLLKKNDLTTIEVFLKYLSLQGIDHHSRAL